MKAWLLDDFTGIGKIRMAEVADPVPQKGEVLLEIHFASLNPADRYLAEAQYPAKPPLPHILGRDGMGTVMQVGAEVDEVRVGERRGILRGGVGVERPGTFAQRVAVPVQDLVEIPAGWSEQEAAGATLVYLTAYQALTMWGPLAPSPVVLVTGASGGVGVAAVQLANAMGHTVIGLSRSAEKGQRLLQLGATATFNPEDPQWRQSLRATLGPRRVDLAIDNIGGNLLPQVIETLGDHGKVSVVGRLAGPVPNFNTAALLFRRIRLGGVAVGTYTNGESGAAWQQVLQLLYDSGARPLVDSVHPFDELPRAFERLAGTHGQGSGAGETVGQGPPPFNALPFNSGKAGSFHCGEPASLACAGNVLTLAPFILCFRNAMKTMPDPKAPAMRRGGARTARTASWPRAENPVAAFRGSSWGEESP